MTDKILDIHHHGTNPSPDAINSIMASDPIPDGDYLFSVGIHPWQTDRENLDRLFESVENSLNDPRVIAIGETGIDRLRGGTLDLQTEIFKRHVNLAAQTGKPLIIHDVRASDIIIPILKATGAGLKSIIHGFRGKPIEAQQLIAAGAYISLGQHFNSDTTRIIPSDRLLAETDESTMSIDHIIETIATTRLTNSHIIKEQIALNTELLGI